MCYRVSYLTQKAVKYAKHYGESPEEVSKLEKQLEVFKTKINAVYQALAQDIVAPEVPVVTNESPREFQLFNWGIVPAWAKEYDDNLRRRFVVSQSEEMFNKNIYRDAAIEKRCLIMIDGYFDHHHRHGKTFPYFIRHKNHDPLFVAGIWSRWTDAKNDLELETFAVLTTRGNKKMQEIHNNPEMLKRQHSVQSRMPVIVPSELWQTWLNPNVLADPADQEKIVKDVCLPYPDELLETYPTFPLNKGREIINSEEVGQPKEYAELKTEQLGLF
ncbi:MAG: SOS response-associated peptidase [Cyclobacteriaceae bacterium]